MSDGVDSGLIDLSRLDLGEVKEMVDRFEGDDGSPLSRMVRRVASEAASAGGASASFSSSI